MIYWIKQFFTRPETHVSALAEVVVTAVISLVPLFITAIVFNYKNIGIFDFASGTSGAVGGGQLFLYAYALLGTIFWLAFMRSDQPMNAPRRIIGFLTFVAALFIVALLGLDPTISNAKNPFILTASYWTYGCFLIAQYLLLFFVGIDPPTAEKSIAGSTKDLIGKYQRMKDAS